MKSSTAWRWILPRRATSTGRAWSAIATGSRASESCSRPLAAGIFGYRAARTLEYARNLGIAFQLTNIIRDVGEDARKNRIYLPMDDLKKFGVPASDILNAKETEDFRNLLAFEASRAKQFYEKAFQSLAPVDRRAQRPGLIM